MKANIVWNENMHFTGTPSSGHSLDMDTVAEVGGEDKAVRPKELVLVGLVGCTSMDVISILRKMQALPEAFRVEAESELTEEHPKMFTKIHLKYFVKGNVPEDKLKRAIELSQDTYCGVSAQLRNGGVKITYEHIYE